KPVEGLRENTPGVYLLKGATVNTRPGETIANGSVLIRDGAIAAVGGADLAAPADARIVDLSGKTIYAGFIDAAVTIGEPHDVSNENTHWNELVRPERKVAAFGKPSSDEMEELRGLGFATVHVLPDNGIFRGQSAVLNLGEEASVVAEDVLQFIAFERASGKYPNSIMGSVALVRQTLLDAAWYRDLAAYVSENPTEERSEANAALAALETVVGGDQQLLAFAQNEMDYGRFSNVAAEFGLMSPAFLGNGYEYRQTDLLKESGAKVIAPLNYPEPPAVEDPDAALEISLEKLEHWEQAPTNAAALADAEVPFCLTTWDLEDSKDKFWSHVRLAVEHGLDSDAALAALTTEPAQLTGLDDRLGSIEVGKLANLVIADGDLFADDEAQIHAVWVDGEPFEMEISKRVDPRGKWTLDWTGVEAAETWTVSGKPDSPKLKADELEFPIQLVGEKLLIFPPAEFFGMEAEGNARLTGFLDAEASAAAGAGVLPGGARFVWSAKIGPADQEAEEEAEAEDETPNVAAFAKYPAGAFGISEIPEQPDVVLVKEATIWTSAAAGRLEGADILIKKGKIAQIGDDLEPIAGALVIDGEGKHVTAGLIDCHSHSAVTGVNESTHAVTVEVRMRDALNPADIALYRQLGGGLTTSSILHGSANPMGGQNQVIKLRWGSRSEGLLFEGAKPGVKFALGENVKQSNWDNKTNRYPQTRMGVEQIMKDTFLAAQDYDRARTAAQQAGKPHRRDLRLEAILEILNNERIVHIHSYRQDEVLMFVRLAQEFDFTVGTFQHILEGYKVADALAEIGAGGSSFSDWWAYKFEVYDAIPYNGAIMHRAGVLTSFNSDSNELATRLNTEAAKAVKYGGVSEEEALKFVTINPAKQLRIDDRVGSLEVGKDADFVIWSASPLSSYARAEQTWIDGRKYFDLETDQQLRETALAERERLIAKALPQRVEALKEKKEDEASDAEGEAKPKMPWFLAKDRNRNPNRNPLCRTKALLLYHNGVDAYTCSGSCCGMR
ncbi:MAG: amidohydrolase family protein, partial [Verrucomicrobiota bacterium]